MFFVVVFCFVFFVFFLFSLFAVFAFFGGVCRRGLGSNDAARVAFDAVGRRGRGTRGGMRRNSEPRDGGARRWP